MSSQQPEMSEMLDFLRTVPTGYVTDSFARLGLTGFITGLQSTRPFQGRHIAGPAVTVQWAPIRGKKSSRETLYQIFQDMDPGSVVVIAGGRGNGMLLGDNVCTAASVAGAEGLILDGCLRDLEDIRESGFPVLYHNVAIRRDYIKEIVGVNVQVTCAGARVHPGDIVVADEDGGIVIPPEYLVEVVKNVRDIASLEKEQAALIRAKSSFAELSRVLVKKTSPRK